jgi:hypothetical protein
MAYARARRNVLWEGGSCRERGKGGGAGKVHVCYNNRALPLPRELDSNVVQTGAATVLDAPVACELKYTLVVVAKNAAEQKRGAVGEFNKVLNVRLSADAAARQSASEPMYHLSAGQTFVFTVPRTYATLLPLVLQTLL